MVMHVNVSGIKPYTKKIDVKELPQMAKAFHSSAFMPGKLFPTDSDFYTVHDNETLRQSAYDIFRWLHIKPAHLKVSYASTTSIRSDGETTQLSLQSSMSSNPFHATSVLTHLIGHYIVNVRNGVLPDDHETNEALVSEFLTSGGLAIVILNGTAGRFKDRHLLNEAQTLKDFSRFAGAWSLDPVTYAGSIAPWAKKKLASGLGPTMKLRLGEPVHIKNFIKVQRSGYIALACSITALMAYGIFLHSFFSVSQTPAVNTPPLSGTAGILQSQLDRCQRQDTASNPSYSPAATAYTPYANRECDELKSYLDYELHKTGIRP